MNNDTEEIMLDLLCKQAVYGLNEQETRQLEKLERGDVDLGSLELTAASIAMVDLNTKEELPAHLQARILAGADEFFTIRDGVGSDSAVAPEAPTREFRFTETKPRISFMDWFGWAVAAAACVALAVNLYYTRLQPAPIVKGPETTQTPIQPPSLSEQREQWLASSVDVIKAEWSDLDPKKPQNVQGDVVWSNSQQKGFIRFRNLPVNDKSKETYQLWIFDKNQDKKTPIDGGVFDATESGEIIIRINRKIEVKDPTMFAVTAEKPGGVVVSELGKVMAVAKV